MTSEKILFAVMLTAPASYCEPDLSCCSKTYQEVRKTKRLKRGVHKPESVNRVKFRNFKETKHTRCEPNYQNM